MTVDFVIVSHESTKDVGRLLLQLALTFPHPHTMTVIDNSRANRGFSVAANLGARQETGEIVAFLNPDIILCDGWATETLAAFAADPKLVIAGPRLDDGFSWPRPLKGVGLKNYVCGAAFFVRRDFFESCGGFDERFFWSSEEVDLCRQAEERGLRVEAVGEPRVKHLWHDAPFKGRETARAIKAYREKWGA